MYWWWQGAEEGLRVTGFPFQRKQIRVAAWILEACGTPFRGTSYHSLFLPFNLSSVVSSPSSASSPSSSSDRSSLTRSKKMALVVRSYVKRWGDSTDRKKIRRIKNSQNRLINCNIKIGMKICHCILMVSRAPRPPAHAPPGHPTIVPRVESRPLFHAVHLAACTWSEDSVHGINSNSVHTDHNITMLR